MEQRIVQRLVCGRSAQGRALALVHTSTSILSSRFHFHTVKDTVLLFFLQLLVLAVPVCFDSTSRSESVLIMMSRDTERPNQHLGGSISGANLTFSDA